MELGDQEAHIHFQGVIVMKVPKAALVCKHIANTLEWTNKATTLPNLKMACSALSQKGMYTFLGLLGYIQKDGA